MKSWSVPQRAHAILKSDSCVHCMMSYRLQNSPTIRYSGFTPKPNDEIEFESARQCAARGLGMAELAIALDADSESGWSYKTNLILALSKFAEMSGNVQQKAEFLRQYKVALDETTRIAEINSKPIR